MTHGLHATDQNQVSPTACDITGRGIDGLQTGTAIALHGPGGHCVFASCPQCGYASDVHFLRAGCDAAKYHFIECVGLERLAEQQRACGLHGEFSGLERSGQIAELEKWRAASVNDEDRALDLAMGGRYQDCAGIQGQRCMCDWLPGQANAMASDSFEIKLIRCCGLLRSQSRS